MAGSNPGYGRFSSCTPRDRKDKKGKIEQTRSSRIFFCRSEPVFHYSHSLVVISFPSLNRNTTRSSG